MLSRKGQLSIFVIVTILIVVGIVLFFAFSKDFLNKSVNKNEAVLGSIRECLDFTTRNSLYLVTYQGGYNHEPEKHFSFSPVFFPYYYHEGDIFIPSIDVIEKEMAEYVDENLIFCIEEIDSSGFNISYGESITEVKIGEEEVTYVVDMSIVLKNDESSVVLELKDGPVYYSSNFLKLYEISEFYVEDLKDDPNYYCISCVGEMALNSNLYFYVVPMVDDVKLVMVFEKGDEPLRLNFVTKLEDDQTNG